MFIAIERVWLMHVKKFREPMQFVDYVGISKGQVRRKLIQMGLDPDLYIIMEIKDGVICGTKS